MDKFNKKRLLKFLTKINLNGLANKFIIKNEDEKTFVDNGLDDTGNLCIKCSISKNLFDEGTEIGIHDVQLLIRYLNLFNLEELNYKFESNEEGVNSKFLIAEKTKNLTYTLAHKDNIPVKDLKKDPEPNYKFTFDEDMIKDVLGALDVSGSKYVNFVLKKANLYLYIGDIDSKDHIIKFKIDNVKTVKDCDIDKITFKADLFNAILKLNDKVNLSLMNGLLVYQNSDDNIDVTYYQRSLKEKSKD